MKYTKLSTHNDNLSYFTDITVDCNTPSHLGYYSNNYPTTNMQFREFQKGLTYDWHNAPQAQYIIYLEGEVEVQASGGETRIFKGGDVLLACDLTGKGHITRTLTKGRSIVVKAE